MRSMPKAALVVFCLFSAPACKNNEGFPQKDTESDTDTELGPLAGSDSSSDTDADSTDADSNSDADIHTDVDTQTDSETEHLDTTDTDTADTASDSDTVEIPPTFCLEHTAEKTVCADCCDCVISDCARRTDCRAQCTAAVLEYNDDLIEFEVPVDRGTDGDYTDCFMRGDEVECKSCCDCAAVYACGDYKYCRENCESMF